MDAVQQKIQSNYKQIENKINQTLWEHLSKKQTDEQTAAKLLNELLTKYPNYDLNSSVNQALQLTLLHINSLYNRTSIVQGLLEKKARVDIQDLNGKTPLHYAANSGNVDTISVLLMYGANINAQTYGGETPIMKAAYQNEQNAIVYLISKNADTTIKNSCGQTLSDILRISHPVVYQQLKQAFPEHIK